MLAWRVTPEQVAATVTAVSGLRYDGNLIFDAFPHRIGKTDRSAVHFTLRVAHSTGPGARFGHMRNKDGNRRRTVAACWHAHRDVLARLFDRYPEARVKTAFADYHGRFRFIQLHHYTGHSNIGSMMDPQLFADACACDKERETV